MNFDDIARIIAQGAPLLFGATVILLVTANVFQTTRRLYILHKAHRMFARVTEIRDSTRPRDVTAESIQELIKQVEEQIATHKNRLETEREAQEEILLDLEQLTSIKEQAQASLAEFEQLEEELVQLDAEVAETQLMLNEMGPPPTLKTMASQTLFSMLPLSTLAVKIAEYVGNVPVKKIVGKKQIDPVETEK